MKINDNNSPEGVALLGWGEKFLPFESLKVDYFLCGKGFKLGDDVISLTQVHSNICVEVSEQSKEELEKVEADAMITQGIKFIAVKTADCLPILISSSDGKIVACVHAGWRGLVSGIIEETLSNFSAKGCDVKDLIVLIGPSIGFENFEVGEEVVEEFDRYTKPFKNTFSWHGKNGKGKSIIGLQSVCVNMLLTEGVPAKKIGVVDVCTMEREDILHSYRRNGKDAGRNWTGIRCAKES